ncbi:hypothetical protein GAYE_SCF07G2934 [Galdieria yellowstonensis]|uniref:FAS1 domain-containing protein n=1 Tax=Galdieria yellowstonensis TaxID=3028027 RepID=A0AAV9IC41_9RHOD|nr:hypothetical protein GAYE_SCF07G2934 [Galdieria yellowstonensis]
MKFFVFSIILANVVLTIQAATVLETLESLKYTEYLDMVKAAGLDSKFNDSAVTWTVFAANNTGVNATLAPKHLVISNITSNATESKDIVEYTLYNHTLLSDDIKTGTTILTAVNGMNLTVVKNTTGIFVNGIMVIKPNITADKSVIYEMESLLIPPDVKL